jgi:hypothetical protein
VRRHVRADLRGEGVELGASRQFLQAAGDHRYW